MLKKNQLCYNHMLKCLKSYQCIFKELNCSNISNVTLAVGKSIKTCLTRCTFGTNKICLTSAYSTCSAWCWRRTRGATTTCWKFLKYYQCFPKELNHSNIINNTLAVGKSIKTCLTTCTFDSNNIWLTSAHATCCAWCWRRTRSATTTFWKSFKYYQY